MRKFIVFILLVSAISLPSCEKFEYNIYQVNPKDKIIEVTTAYNLDRISKLPQKNTLRIVFIGDTQRFYEDLNDFVIAVNSLPNVDAVIITGDITDFGTQREYEWINRELKKINVPFLTVIGNHDHLANSRQLYQEIYGPLNYSFTWNKIRFVMHDTNGREYGFDGSAPDLSWMREQISDEQNFNHSIFVSHVPPYDNDFDNSLEDEYVNIIRNAKNNLVNVCGHRHNYSVEQPYPGNIWYVNTSSPKHRVFSIVTLYPYATSGKKFDIIAVPF